MDGVAFRYPAFYKCGSFHTCKYSPRGRGKRPRIGTTGLGFIKGQLNRPFYIQRLRLGVTLLDLRFLLVYLHDLA